MIKKIFDLSLIKHPLKSLIFLFLGVLFLAYYCTKLEIDASAETLLLEDDKDLQFTRKVSKLYYNPDFLIVAFTPKEDLLSQNSLNIIKNISEDFLKIENIASINSILNVPLLQSPIQDLTKLVDGIRTIENSKNIDKHLVKKEFLNSEIYSNSLVSEDFKTTAIILNFKFNEKYFKFIEQRDSLIKKKNNNTITEKEIENLERIQEKFKVFRDIQRQKNSKDILAIRNIIKKYETRGSFFLGGVNMISDDIINFVKSDLLIYGSSLIILLTLILWIIFRQLIWVLLPLVICVLSVISTTGALGYFSWEVTVISSNFIALQLIITISIVLHLIVRYNELNSKYKNANQYKLVINTVLSKLNPSFFAIITTVAGFSSLVFSGIEPVKNLGWMMSTGIIISLIISFIVFTCVLILLKKVNIKKKSKFKLNLVHFTKIGVKRYGSAIIFGSIILVIFSLSGASKLLVENSFINYFKESTQIYKGMKVIDEKLGGTTPLDVIITFKNQEEQNNINSEDSFASFEDEFNEDKNNPKYWFTKDKMQIILKVHNYLDSLEEIGKVQSLASMLKVGKILNKGRDLDGFKLALLYEELPEEYRKTILEPYINIKNNQARITTRIMDSNPNLRRNELIEKINEQLPIIINSKNVEFRLSNLMILYNNMLQSLFDSQIKTLGFVIFVLFLMFLILFKSFKIASIAILANLVPISIVFGIMGWLEIPLDIMTITIAAISIGIGVDDTIHYIHRFKEEYKKDHNYLNAMERSHDSIGYAMGYTSLVVIVGFSILVLSNLVPTIYFGLLTVIVMVIILSSALLLLPKLLISFKPYKAKEKGIN